MTTKKATETTLPTGITKSDLTYPKNAYKMQARSPVNDGYGGSYEQPMEFRLWFVESFGWCIPTLRIAKSGRANQSHSGGERTYAVTMDGDTVRIGNGPHVKATHTVYIKKTRLAKLQKYWDLKGKGEVDANMIRDRRSSRRIRRSRW